MTLKFKNDLKALKAPQNTIVVIASREHIVQRLIETYT